MIKLPSDEEFEQIRRETSEPLRAELARQGVDYDSVPELTDEEFNSPEVQQIIKQAMDETMAEEFGEDFDKYLEQMKNSDEFKKEIAYIFDPNISLAESHRRLCEIYPDCAYM